MTTNNPRRRLLAPAIASAALAAAVLIAPGVTDTTASASQEQGQRQARPPSLSQRIPNFSLEDTPLEDALRFVENLSGVSFHVDWVRLEQVGVDRNTPVSLQLRGTSVRKTLTMILDHASVFDPLTFYVDAGIVHITTLEHADSEMIVRVYDIRDLLHVAPDFVGGFAGGGGFGGGGGGFGGGGGGLGGGGGGGLGGGGGFGGGGGGLGGGGGGMGGGGLGGGGGGLGGGGGGLGGGGGGLGGGGGGGAGGSGNIASQEERAEELIELITEVIRPDIWKANGGEATIRYFNGNLVINAPRSVHDLL